MTVISVIFLWLSAKTFQICHTHIYLTNYVMKHKYVLLPGIDVDGMRLSEQYTVGYKMFFIDKLVKYINRSNVLHYCGGTFQQKRQYIYLKCNNFVQYHVVMCWFDQRRNIISCKSMFTFTIQ